MKFSHKAWQPNSDVTVCVRDIGETKETELL